MFNVRYPGLAYPVGGVSGCHHSYELSVRDGPPTHCPGDRATHVHVGDGREAPAGGPLLDGGHPGLHGHIIGNAGRLGGRDDLVGFVCNVDMMVGTGVSDRGP